MYFAAARFGLSLAFSAAQVSAVWPPSGIALAALLFFGYRLWPGVALGALLVNATAHEPFSVALAIAAGNTLEALIGAWLLNHFVGTHASPQRLKDVAGLIVLSAGLSTIVSATIGVSSLCLGGVQTWSAYSSLWSTWWLGDAMGDVVVAPMLLTLADWQQARWRPRRLTEAAVVLLGLGAVSIAVFFDGPTEAGLGYPQKYVVFPFVMWAALRFGQPGAAVAIFVTLGIAILGTVSGSAPFMGAGPDERVIHLQLYMAVVAISALLLGAVISERETAEATERLATPLPRCSRSRLHWPPLFLGCCK